MNKIISKTLFAVCIIFGLSISTQSVFAATTVTASTVSITPASLTSVNIKTTINFADPAKSGLVPASELKLVNIIAAASLNATPASTFTLDRSSVKFMYNTPTVFTLNMSPLVRQNYYVIYVRNGTTTIRTSDRFKINELLSPTATFAPITVVQDGTIAKVTTAVT